MGPMLDTGAVTVTGAGVAAKAAGAAANMAPANPTDSAAASPMWRILRISSSPRIMDEVDVKRDRAPR